MTIKEHRKVAGLTQQQFAELFNIPVDTVKAWDCGRRKADRLKEKLIIEKLERMVGDMNISEEYFNEKIREHGFEIDIKFENTYAGNRIRYFFFKGQKIYFDGQAVNGGTYFGWTNEEFNNLLFIFENINESDGIYMESPLGIELDFTWGMKESLSNVNFSGYWHEVDEKICKKVG